MTRDEALAAVRAALRGMLDDPEHEIGEEEKIAGDLGFDSVDVADLVFRLEKEAGVDLTAEDWDLLDQGTATVNTLVDLVLKRRAG